VLGLITSKRPDLEDPATLKARIAEVTSDGEKLIVKGEDTLVKRPITIPFDMDVHAIGMDPNVDNPEISDTLGIDLETHGFIDVAHRYGSMGATSRPGVYVAGGYGARGFTWAPWAASILAARLAGGPPPAPVGALRGISPMRFVLRSLRRGQGALTKETTRPPS